MRETDWTKVKAGLQELLFGTVGKGLYYVAITIFMAIDFIGGALNWLWGGDSNYEERN